VSTSGGTETLTRPELQHGSGDAEHRTHIVKRPPDREARVLRFEVEALCGFRWVPSRDPQRYPVCEACRDVLAHLG